MKTSFRTIKISIFTIIITCCFTFAEESSGTNSEPVFPERPVKSNQESDAAYLNRLTQWQAEIIRIAAETNSEISPNNPTLPKRPVKREGEIDASFNNRIRQWEAEIKSIITAANTEESSNNPNIFPRPEKRMGESDASFRNRTAQWEAVVRRLTSDANQAVPVRVSTIPARPEKRSGESDASYQNRLRTWEFEVRRITSAQTTEQKDAELRRLKEQLDRLSAQVLPTSRTSNYTNTDSENMLIIPSGEMKTEDLLNINEDMNVMSRILLKELINTDITLPSPVFGALFTSNYGLADNTLNCIFIQGYGALFLIKAGFPLSAPSETAEQPEEPDKEDVDSVWEQTRQQIYQPQAASTTFTNTRGSDVKYDAQRIENLKTTLIKALKHATNIRTLKPDESVILRISGSGQSINIISVQKDGDQSLIIYESNGIRQLVMISEDSGDLDDYIKSLSTPTVILIQAKKSDIDAFSKGEIDLEKFHQRVQIISYPLLQTSLPSAATGRISSPFETRGTTPWTSSSTTGRRTSRTSVVPAQPANEPENYR